MSSGENAKPPASYQERNPFDISRRSEKDVAAEIAKRMAAWKSARGRSYATSTTVPSDDAKQPAPAAPVQPARMPSAADRPAQTQPFVHDRRMESAERPKSSGATQAQGGTRAPFFASFSIQRAMPPAPSPKRAAAQPPRENEVPAESVAERPQSEKAPVLEALTAGTPVEEAPSKSRDLATPVIQPAVEAARIEERAIDLTSAQEPTSDLSPAEAPAIDEPSAESALPAMEARVVEVDARGDEPRTDIPAPTRTESASPVPGHKEITDRLRAKARDIRQRWMTAHDVDVPSTEELSPAKRASDGPAMAEHKADAADTPKAEGVSSTTPAMAAAIPPIEVLDKTAGRREPILGEPAARPVDAAAASVKDAPQESRAPTASDLAFTSAPAPMLDEAPGRREPTLDEPAILARPVDTAATRSADVEEVPEERRRTETIDVTAAMPPIEMLDEMSGRREPTFDGPVVRKRSGERPAPAAKRRIELPAMETRIEARRIDTLRADPSLAGRRPIFPRIEPDEWIVPPAVAARSYRTHGGTGWAIGLGTVLLAIGITAPAAIWQQGRHSSTPQDQVTINLAPLPPEQQASQVPLQANRVPQQANQGPAVPMMTQPEQAPADQAAQAPAPQLQSPSQPAAAPSPGPTSAGSDQQTAALPSPAVVPDSKAEAGGAAEEQTTLSAIRDGGMLNEAPISAPPPPSENAEGPTVNLASRNGPEPFLEASSPMVARPFIPDQKPAPFLRAPTTGTASVAVNGSAPAARSASVGLKPALMGQLKPKVAAAKPVASKPQAPVRKPKPFFQQTPEEMFRTLVDTLSDGSPPKRAPQQEPPSVRR